MNIPGFDFEQLFRNAAPPSSDERCQSCEQYHFLCECTKENNEPVRRPAEATPV